MTWQYKTSFKREVGRKPCQVLLSLKRLKDWTFLEALRMLSRDFSFYPPLLHPPSLSTSNFLPVRPYGFTIIFVLTRIVTLSYQYIYLIIMKLVMAK
jgi:hypothetical protein